MFDYLLEDSDTLMTIARSNPPENAEKKERVQKTFVLSKKSLSTLNKVLDKVEVSRDEFGKMNTLVEQGEQLSELQMDKFKI